MTHPPPMAMPRSAADTWSWSRIWPLAVLAGCLLVTGMAHAQRVGKPDAFKGIDIQERLGDLVPLDLPFVDETGRPVVLRDYFDGRRPVVLVLAYYDCPMLCTFVLNGVSEAVRLVELQPGEQFRLLTISIDPSETPALAAAKRESYVQSVNRNLGADEWHFLTGRQEAIDALAAALGFIYFYDEEQQEYAHPAVVHVLTPDGTISRYLYGIKYRDRDLKLALLEASRGTIGSIVDRVILYCFHYNAKDKQYALFAMNIMRLGGVVTLLLLGLLLGVLWSRERQRRRHQPPPAAAA
jgi:protein SCO1